MRGSRAAQVVAQESVEEHIRGSVERLDNQFSTLHQDVATLSCEVRTYPGSMAGGLALLKLHMSLRMTIRRKSDADERAIWPRYPFNSAYDDLCPAELAVLGTEFYSSEGETHAYT